MTMYLGNPLSLSLPFAARCYSLMEERNPTFWDTFFFLILSFPICSWGSNFSLLSYTIWARDYVPMDKGCRPIMGLWLALYSGCCSS